MDDIIIAHPFEIDPRIFGVRHKYFDATFVITTCILMLTALVIYMAHRYRRTRVHVEVRTIGFPVSSNVPHNTEECWISLCNFIVGYQLASLQPYKHVYRWRCIARVLSRNPTYPICWGVLTDGDDWVWHADDETRMLSFFLFFLGYNFLYTLTIMTMLIYTVA